MRQPLEPQQPAASSVAQAEGQAIADLAKRLGIDSSDIEVVLARRHTWNDGSVGCPEPGKFYTQALVPGYRVVLEVDGKEYAYHGADGRPLFYCADPVVNRSPDN